MKHRLPTVSGAQAHRRGAGRPKTGGRPVERVPLETPVVAVAHINQGAAASRFAVQLCAAFVHEGASVAALVSIDNSAGAHEAQTTLSSMLDAGARQAKLVRRPEGDAHALFASAVEQLAGESWLVAYGNTLPQLFAPLFTVVVTGHRRDLTAVDALVLQAQLEVTTPGDELATLLARRLVEQRAQES
jgi:hypothetical protein